MKTRNTNQDLAERAWKIIYDEEWNDIEPEIIMNGVLLYNERTGKRAIIEANDTDEIIRDKIGRSYKK